MHRKPDAPMATIIVKADSLLLGPRYTIHEDLLAHYSPFFKAALQGNFAEAESKTVTLNAHPIDVEHFIFWIYHQRFPDKIFDDSAMVEQWGLDWDEDRGSHQIAQMMSLYLFCDKYDVPELKEVLIDGLFTVMEDYESGLPSTRSIKDAFDKLPDNDPLCQLLADVHSQFASADVWLADEAAEYPWPFVARVLARYTEFAHGGLSRENDLERCDYHGHQDGKEREACRRQ